MKRVLLMALCAMFVTVFFASAASAAIDPNNRDVRVAAHAVSGCILKGCDPLCSADPVVNQPNLPCSQYTVNWPTNSGSFTYAVVGQAGAVGVTGISFGINYVPHGKTPALFLTSLLCADGLEFPSASPNIVWPNPLSGNRITWASCQGTNIAPDGIHATAYSFYLYAYGPDTFEIGPHTALAGADELDVTDCGNNTVKLLSITAPSLVPLLTAKVQFGAGSGVPAYNPCGVVATEDATWGKLKTLYEDSE